VTSSGMPFMLGKSRPVASPIPPEGSPRAVADYCWGVPVLLPKS
jgi:hypothetical protein